MKGKWNWDLESFKPLWMINTSLLIINNNISIIIIEWQMILFHIDFGSNLPSNYCDQNLKIVSLGPDVTMLSFLIESFNHLWIHPPLSYLKKSVCKCLEFVCPIIIYYHSSKEIWIFKLNVEIEKNVNSWWQQNISNVLLLRW